MGIKDFEKDTKPRVIFVYTCERIAEPLKQFGFNYRKSKNDILKMDNDFIFYLYFRPHQSRGSTSFWVHVRVESDIIGRWRCRDNNIENPNTKVIDTTLAMLTKRDDYLPLYSVSALTERERVISEITCQINDFAIPFFQRFNNVPQLVEEVRQEGFFLPHRKKHFKFGDVERDFMSCFGS